MAQQVKDPALLQLCHGHSCSSVSILVQELLYAVGVAKKLIMNSLIFVLPTVLVHWYYFFFVFHFLKIFGWACGIQKFPG